MKMVRWYALAALLATLVLSSVAAAEGAKEGEVRLEITSRLGVLARVAKGYKVCKLAQSGLTQPVSGEILAESSSVDPRTRFFLRRMAREGVECAKGGSRTFHAMTVQKPAAIKDLPAEVTSSIPMVGPTFMYPVEDELAAIAGEVLRLEDPTCKMLGMNEDKVVDSACRLEAAGQSFKIVPVGTPAPRASRIALTYKTGNKKVAFPIAICEFTLDGAIPVLVQGARSQRVRLARPEDAELRCDARLADVRTLKEGDVTLHWRAAPIRPADAYEFDVSPVPAALSPGVHTLDMLSASGKIGTLKVTVVAPIQASPKIEVRYDVKNGEGLDPSFAGANGTNDGVAVVNPRSKEPASITNRVEITMPSPLPVASTGAAFTSSAGGSPAAVELASARDVGSGMDWSELWGAESKSSRLAWRLLATPLARVNVQDCTNASGGAQVEKGVFGEPTCLLDSRLDALVFSVPEPTVGPVAVMLALDRFTLLEVCADDSADSQPDEKPRCESKLVRETLLETRVDLAKSARVESVPMPIREALAVSCEEKQLGGKPADRSPIRHDQTRGVENDALEAGRCKLHLRDTQSAPKYPIDLYGPQSMIVTIQQRGGQKVEHGVVLSSKNREFTLPAPPGAKADGEVYDVQVRLTNKAESLDGAVKYRTGTFDAALASAALSRGEQELVVHLRPFGRFGYGNINEDWPGLRTYLSIATDLGGIRFPAAARDLKNTSQPTSYQLVGPRPGVLFTIEPWDYDSAKNPFAIGAFPLPLALQGGLHLTKITDDQIDVSLLAGLSLNVPLFDGAPSQLGTTAGIGFYYENDLRGGHYLLTTFGFKIGSLFSGAIK